MAIYDFETVQPGCQVTYRCGGEETTIRIADKAHPRTTPTGWVSAQAPLAKALLGLRVHDFVEYQTHPTLPAKVLTVISIVGPPE